jgi:hypothetical protein
MSLDLLAACLLFPFLVVAVLALQLRKGAPMTPAEGPTGAPRMADAAGRLERREWCRRESSGLAGSTIWYYDVAESELRELLAARAEASRLRERAETAEARWRDVTKECDSALRERDAARQAQADAVQHLEATISECSHHVAAAEQARDALREALERLHNEQGHTRARLPGGDWRCYCPAGIVLASTAAAGAERDAAVIAPYKAALEWIKTDLLFKAPEVVDSAVSARIIERIDHALDGESTT